MLACISISNFITEHKMMEILEYHDVCITNYKEFSNYSGRYVIRLLKSRKQLESLRGELAKIKCTVSICSSATIAIYTGVTDTENLQYKIALCEGYLRTVGLQCKYSALYDDYIELGINLMGVNDMSIIEYRLSKLLEITDATDSYIIIK